MNRAGPRSVECSVGGNGAREWGADVLRALTAAAVMLSAVVHLDLYAAGFSQLPRIGPLFLAAVLAGLVLGVAAVSWRHWLPLVLAAGFAAVTVGAYWISVVHGLFGLKEVTTGWAEILAEVAEYVAIACGLTAAALLWRARPPRPHPGRSG